MLNGSNILKCAYLIEININKEIYDEFFNKNIITNNNNYYINNNGLDNDYNCSFYIWNSVDNDLDIIIDIFALYEESHTKQFESNIIYYEKNATIYI